MLYNNYEVAMTKDELKYKMAEMVGNLAIVAPPLRDGFWDSFKEKEIELLQTDIFNKALETIEAILKDEKDPESLASHLYSHKRFQSSLIDEAKSEMTKFFKDYIDFIYRNVNFHDSPIHVPYGGPVPFDAISKHTDLTFDEMQLKAKQMQDQHSKDFAQKMKGMGF